MLIKRQSGGNQCSSGGNQRSSVPITRLVAATRTIGPLGVHTEVIRGHQSSSEFIRGHQRSSEVIRGHQRPRASRARLMRDALKDALKEEALRGTQRHSEALRGTQRQAASRTDMSRLEGERLLSVGQGAPMLGLAYMHVRAARIAFGMGRIEGERRIELDLRRSEIVALERRVGAPREFRQ